MFSLGSATPTAQYHQTSQRPEQAQTETGGQLNPALAQRRWGRQSRPLAGAGVGRILRADAVEDPDAGSLAGGDHHLALRVDAVRLRVAPGGVDLLQVIGARLQPGKAKNAVAIRRPGDDRGTRAIPDRQTELDSLALRIAAAIPIEPRRRTVTGQAYL